MITFYDILLAATVAVGLPAWSWASRRWYADGAVRRVTRYWVVAVRGAVLSLLVIVAWQYAGRPLRRLGLDAPVGARGRAGFAVDVLIAAYYVAVHLRRRSAEHMTATRERLRAVGSYNMLPRTPAEFRVYPRIPSDA